MKLGQLSAMLGELRAMFDENPNGMTIPADLARMLRTGAQQMHSDAVRLEQFVLEHVEQQLDAAEPQGFRLVPPSPEGNVIAFPRPLRPLPLGGA